MHRLPSALQFSHDLVRNPPLERHVARASAPGTAHEPPGCFDRLLDVVAVINVRVTSAACDCGMLFITVTLLMMQLQSFSLLFLVLSVVPLGLIGVVAALLLFRQPLGFVAILGILSLLGMIARNGVILIDQIEAVRAEGVAVWNAVIEAATSRFRPIMLTAISTVLGMIPIAPTIFWGPMAYAIMGGRAPGGDAVDVAVSSRALRRLVPRQGAG